jgi:hypothetical protein
MKIQEIPTFQNTQVKKYPGYEIPKLQNTQVTKYPSYTISQFTKFPSYKVSWGKGVLAPQGLEKSGNCSLIHHRTKNSLVEVNN